MLKVGKVGKKHTGRYRRLSRGRCQIRGENSDRHAETGITEHVFDEEMEVVLTSGGKEGRRGMVHLADKG